MKSHHKKTIYRGEYRGWGLGKKEGGGVFEWDEGGGGGGVDTSQCTLCNRYFHDGNFMSILKSFQAQGVAKK